MRRAKGKIIKVKVRYMNKDGRTASSQNIPFPLGKRPLSSTKLNETVNNVDMIPAPEQEPIPDIAPSTAFDSQTCYTAKKQEEVEAWCSLRESLFKAYVSNEAPVSHQCIYCFKEKCNIIRCRDCGPCYIACQKCYRTSHKHLVFHVPEIWKDSHFSRWYDDLAKITGDHECDQCYTRQLTVLDAKSRLHQTLVSFCESENENVTLIKRGLWGATPIQPSVAYSIQLLDLLTALQLEGHLSTKAFVDSLLYLNHLTESEVKAMYRLLVSDCISEFHYLRHKIRMLPHAEETLQCPACPKHNGDLIVSMDANFGLVRKMNAGEGFKNEKMSSDLFLDETETDKFVETYDDNSNGVTNCSTFKAGNKLRSKMKWAKLAVKGVFGVACRHEVPVHLLDMKHGERLAYPVLMLNKLVENKPKGIRLHVLYDIACTLKSHLKKRNRTSLLEEIDLTLPIFHAYGHKSSCQRWIQNKRISQRPRNRVPKAKIKSIINDKPKRQTGRHLFYSEYYKNEEGDNNLKSADAAWKALTSEKREEYKKRAATMNAHSTAESLNSHEKNHMFKMALANMQKMCTPLGESGFEVAIVGLNRKTNEVVVMGTPKAKDYWKVENIQNFLIHIGHDTSAAVPSSETLRSEVQTLFNTKYGASGAKKKVSYLKVNEGKISWKGFPKGITLKKPSSYSHRDKLAILAAKDQIEIFDTPENSATTTTFEEEDTAVNAEETNFEENDTPENSATTTFEEEDTAVNAEETNFEKNDLTQLCTALGVNMNSEDEYIVEKIINRRKHKGKMQYLVKWKDFHESENTWEPSCNIPLNLRKQYKKSITS